MIERTSPLLLLSCHPAKKQTPHGWSTGDSNPFRHPFALGRDARWRDGESHFVAAMSTGGPRVLRLRSLREFAQDERSWV